MSDKACEAVSVEVQIQRYSLSVLEKHALARHLTVGQVIDLCVDLLVVDQLEKDEKRARAE
jgi:hypothetical protein